MDSEACIIADPVSIAGSIAGLITIAEVAFRRSFVYVKAAKDAPKGVTALALEINAIHGLLHSIQLIAYELDGEQINSTLQQQHINACIQPLEKIKAMLDKYDTSGETSRVRKATKILRWPFSTAETKALLDELSRHKATLSLALTRDQGSGFLQIMSTQNAIRTEIRDIRTEMNARREIETRISLDERKEKILDWMSDLTPEKNQQMSLKLRQPNTGLWLTEGEEFSGFLKVPHSSLWCYGIPGAGKTILASSLIEKALGRSDSNVGVAYFYCDYKDPRTQDLMHVLSTIAKQLALQHEENFRLIDHFYRSWHDPKRIVADFSTINLAGLIIDMAATFETTMIFVDGVDECEKNMADVTITLSSIAQTRRSDVRTVLLSRDEYPIRENIKNLDHWAQVCIAAQNSDLKLYVGAEIDRKKMRVKDRGLIDYIMEELIQGAQGMFRWVTCQIDHLCELPSDAARRRALKSLPPTLNATYERILDRVNRSNREVQSLVQRSLIWIVTIPRLKVATLCEVVSVEAGDTHLDTEAVPEHTEILRHCSSLVRLSTDGTYLELAHFTVEEYLKSIDAIATPHLAKFRIPESQKSPLCAQVVCTSLTYLLLQDFNVRLNSDTEMQNLGDPILHWWTVLAPHHMDADVFELVKTFFDPAKSHNFLNWAIKHAMQISRNDNNKGRSIYDKVASMSTLHWTANLRLPRICSWLAQNGSDVNQETMIGTPLIAALLGNVAFYEYPKSYDLDTTEKYAATPIVRELLSAGADAHCQFRSLNDGATYSALHIAIAARNTPTTIDLLVHGATFDTKTYSYMGRMAYSEIDRTFYASVLEGIEEAQLRKEDYNWLLSCAMGGGYHEHLSSPKSIQRRSSMNLIEALAGAAYSGQESVVRHLVQDLKVNVNARISKTGSSALIESTKLDQVNVLKFLLDHGSDCTIYDQYGRGPLQYSVLAETFNCLPFILKQAPDVHHIDNDKSNIWHLAASSRSAKALEMLLQEFTGKDGRAISNESGNHLHPACGNTSTDPSTVMSVRLSKELRALDNEGLQPIDYAVKTGSGATIGFFIEQGIHPSRASHDGAIPWHDLIRAGPQAWNLDAIDVLDDAGINIASCDSNNENAIFVLAREVAKSQDDVDKAERLLHHLVKKGVDVNQRSTYGGMMPLHFLCTSPASYDMNDFWEFNFADNLLKLNCSLTIENDRGLSPIDLLLETWQHAHQENDKSGVAAQTDMARRCARMISVLLRHSQKRNDLRKCFKSTHDLLFLLLWVSWDSTNINDILRTKKEVNKTVSFVSKTPLQAACLSSSSLTVFKQMIQLSDDIAGNVNKLSELLRLHCRSPRAIHDANLHELLRLGADPNTLGMEGETALMLASEAGKVFAVETLLRHGANVNVQNANGWNAAFYACYAGKHKVLPVLHDAQISWDVTASAKLFDVWNDGLSMAHFAAYLRDSTIMSWLLKHDLGGDLNGQDSFGMTPLYVASLARCNNVVRLLLQHGVLEDLSPRSTGETPLHAAARSGFHEVVKVFIELSTQ